MRLLLKYIFINQLKYNLYWISYTATRLDDIGKCALYGKIYSSHVWLGNLYVLQLWLLRLVKSM